MTTGPEIAQSRGEPPPTGEPMPAPIRAYVRWVDGFTGIIGLLAMYLVFLMIGVLLFDAVTRNVIRIPQHWPIEFAQFTLAAYYFSGGAYSLREGAHVRMDLLYDRLSVRGKAGLDAVTSFCMLFYLCVLLWGSISSLRYSIETNQKLFSMWNPSVVPIKILMTAAIVLMILQAVSMICKDWATFRGRPIR
jgi:TRAP-type mannitol/chloroaromatic compound transport system permease small subunit